MAKHLPANSNATATWTAISSAVPDQRYLLFKSVADSLQHKKWHCKSMEKLAPKTGHFE